MSRVLSFLYGIACYAIFFVTFLYLIGFLGNFLVPLSVDRGPVSATGTALAIDLALIALFGLQHSIMARPGFKAVFTKVVPHSIERSTYVLLSSLVLILLYWQWRPLPQVIWQAEAAWSVAALWFIFAAGFTLVLLSTFVIDHFDLFGLRQVTLNLLRKQYTHPGFKVTLFYKFVRHPLYVGWIMAFWAIPTMTLGHLLFAVGMTGYILIAIRYEERDLERFLGSDYVQYKQRVPMLLPRIGVVHETVKPGPAATAPSSMR